MRVFVGILNKIISMKKIIFTAILAFFAVAIANAQEQSVPEEQTVQISLPKYCCSESDALIEKTLAYEKGVESFQLNPITKSVLVTFKTKKTNQMKIEKALAKAGFETPNFKANERAVAKLPNCCKNTIGDSVGLRNITISRLAISTPSLNISTEKITLIS